MEPHWDHDGYFILSLSLSLWINSLLFFEIYFSGYRKKHVLKQIYSFLILSEVFYSFDVNKTQFFTNPGEFQYFIPSLKCHSGECRRFHLFAWQVFSNYIWCQHILLRSTRYWSFSIHLFAAAEFRGIFDTEHRRKAQKHNTSEDI